MRKPSVAAIPLVMPLVLLSSSPADAAAKQPLVKLIAGNAREVLVDRDRVNVGFPVALARGVRARDVAATVIAVTRGKHAELRLRDAFGARIAPPVLAQTALLVVTVAVAPRLVPGTYDLVVAGRSKTRKNVKPTARVMLRIIVPRATVAAPKSLVVERTLPAWILGGGDDARPPFRLHETSRRSRLSNIDVEQGGPAKAGDHSTGSSLVFTPPDTIAPGGFGTATYKLSGSAFDEPGTVTGSAEVTASELASPASVSYEIRITRSKRFILIFAFLGLVMGFLVRILLQRIIDVSRAQQAAADLAARIEHAKNQGDATLRADLASAETALEPAFDWLKTPAAVEAAVNAAGKLYGTATTDYAKRLRQALDHQAAFAAVVQKSWLLPPGLDAALSHARDALAVAKNELDRDRADEATTTLTTAEAALTSDVAESARTWKEEVAQLLNATESPITPPASVAESLKPAREKMRAALDALDPDRDLTDLLPRLHEAIDAFRGVRQALLTVEYEVQSVLDRRPAAGAELESAWDRLRAALSNDASSPDEIRQRYWPLIQKLKDAEDQVVQTPGVSTRLGGEAAAAARAGALIPLLMATPAPIAAEATPAPRLLPTLAPARTLRARAATTLIAAWALQWVLLSAIFIGLAYVLFADGFEGTWQDMAKVFFWAFALDVTANTLLEQAKGAPKTTPAGA